MKKIIQTTSAIFVLFIMSMWGCTLDNGSDGFDPRDNYTGQWTCNDTPARSLLLTYPVIIVKDTLSDYDVYLENFAFIGFDEKPPYGTLSGNIITIPTQQICNDNSWTVSGTGNIINDNRIEWEYQIKVGGDKNSYKAVFTR
jgi:hypothetical protein